MTQSVVISDLLHKNHISPICSKSGIVALIIIFTALALPLLLVRMTHSKLKTRDLFFLDYWIDTITYYEQPNIKHMNEIMVYMYTDDGVFCFGSTKNLNDLFDGSFEESSQISP